VLITLDEAQMIAGRAATPGARQSASAKAPEGVRWKNFASGAMRSFFVALHWSFVAKRRGLHARNPLCLGRPSGD